MANDTDDVFAVAHALVGLVQLDAHRHVEVVKLISL